MAEIEIKTRVPLTYAEVAEKLKVIKKSKKTEEELGFRTKKAEEFLESFDKEDFKRMKELKESIKNLNIQRLKDKQIVALVNINPTDEDSIKTILSNDNITLKQEDIQALLDCLKK